MPSRKLCEQNNETAFSMKGEHQLDSERLRAKACPADCSTKLLGAGINENQQLDLVQL